MWLKVVVGITLHLLLCFLLLSSLIFYEDGFPPADCAFVSSVSHRESAASVRVTEIKTTTRERKAEKRRALGVFVELFGSRTQVDIMTESRPLSRGESSCFRISRKTKLMRSLGKHLALCEPAFNCQ